MKIIEELTLEEINEIFGVILDSKKQTELMEDILSDKSWMLDFVYDSKLLQKLEKYSETKMLDLELSNNKTNKNSIKV